MKTVLWNLLSNSLISINFTSYVQTYYT
jgi:hypothetical protein